MQKPALIAIVAVDEGGVIGNKGKLPWHIPEDLKWFREQTRGGAVLMGRKTFDSIGKPLPERTNIVLSRSMLSQANVTILRDVQEIFSLSYSKIYVIGGAEIYKQLLPFCQQLLITHVEGHHDGDTFFPEYRHLFEPQQTLAEFPGAKIIAYQRKS